MVHTLKLRGYTCIGVPLSKSYLKKWLRFVRVVANATVTRDDDAQMFSCRLSFDREAGDTEPPPTMTDRCATYVHVIRKREMREFVLEYVLQCTCTLLK